MLLTYHPFYKPYFIKFLLIMAPAILWSCSKKHETKQETKQEENYKIDASSWESLANQYQDPEWFADTKLGIYFTWGPYSESGYPSEWYPRWMYMPGRPEYDYHVKNFGDPAEFAYHDFIPGFLAENYNPKEWASLFKDTGARFAGPIAQHHDGFAMWDSQVNPWNSVDMGPKRDIVGELLTELEKEGLKTIATFHHARTYQRFAKDTANWGHISSYFPYHPDYATSSDEDSLRYLYGNLGLEEFRKYWFDEVKEVVDQYSPDIIWFDSGLDSLTEDYRRRMVASQLESGLKHGKKTLVCYKQEDLPSDVGVMDIEQGGMRNISEEWWMSDMTISEKSWSYYLGQTYKPASLLIRNMIDIWSKRGIVLLNVSPDGKGNISIEQRNIMAKIGAWIDQHQEAVYETRPYHVYGYGVAKVEDGTHGGMKATTVYGNQDIRFTVSKDGQNIFVYVLGMPDENTELEVNQLNTKIKSVSLVGSGAPLEWTHSDDKLLISTPASEKMNSISTVFKIELDL